MAIAGRGGTRVEYPIIDADAHIHEDTADLALFATGTLRRILELEKAPERWLDTPGYSALTVYDPPRGENPKRQIQTLTTPEMMRADMERRGVDAVVLHTGRYQAIAARQDVNYAVNLMQTYNRYLRQRWTNPAQGLYGALMVAPQDALKGAEEIERYAGDSHFAAIYLPLASVYPLWGHPQYEPIYAAAAAAGLPLALHGYTQVHTVFPWQLEQFETALAKQALAKPFAVMANLAGLITGGALARHPKLKVVAHEAGAAWLPVLFGRLDRQQQFLRAEVPFYPDRISEAVRRQIYVTTHSMEDVTDMQVWVDWVRGGGILEQMVFASDAPHYDADAVERVLELPLTREEQRKILCENALAAFRLAALVEMGGLQNFV